MAKSGDTLIANTEPGGFFPRGLHWLDLKAKYKRCVDAKDESVVALESLCGMFEYEGLPDTVDTDFLELYFITEGMASIRRDTDGDGEYYAMVCADESAPNPYGLGEMVISRTENGHVYEDKRNSKEVAFGYNNATKTPNTDYFKLAADLAEIDVSLDFLVWYSRVSRLFAVCDEKQKQMITEAFKNVTKGVPLTVVSNNLMAQLEEGTGLNSIDITDVDYADKIMRLCEYREARNKWFFERYGMAKRTVSKKAQVSKDEANGDTAASFILPLNMLHAREKFIDECNKKFGWDASVHFAGAFLGEMERYEDTVVENEELDIDGYEAITEDKEDVEDDRETLSESDAGDTNNTV